MANIKDRNGYKEIRFVNVDGKYSSLYAGKISKRAAESIGTKLEAIVSLRIQGRRLDADLSEWVAGLSDRFHQKLVRLGLDQAREREEPQPQQLVPTIKQWTDQYIKNHPGKDSTIEQLTITARSLCKRFGDDKRLDTFTKGDAADFTKWLQSKGNERKKYKTGLALNTVRRRIGRTKQFFNHAVNHELLDRNPFAAEASATTGNADRYVEVPTDWIERCIRNTPDDDFRIMLALARYGGLRRHECRIQLWDDIDIPNRVMKVRSHKSPPVRWCPIFPELMPHLMRAREMAAPGATKVQSNYPVEMNLDKLFQQCAKRAGLKPWGKPWQNLRATRETELMGCYPAKDVTTWLGNSPDVANKHYLMPSQESFQRAVVEGAKLGAHPKAPNNAPKTVQANGGNSETGEMADSADFAKDAVFLLVSQDALPQSCPTRT